MANQSLQNLRKIHELQKEGEINQILRDIRNTKSQVENFGKELSNRRKQLETEILMKSQVKQEPVEVEKVEKVETKTSEPTFIDEKKQDKQTYKKFENSNNQKNFKTDKPVRNNDGKFNKTPFNKDKKDNRPYNSFNKNNPQNKKFGNNNFVSAKGNNYRSFAEMKCQKLN